MLYWAYFNNIDERNTRKKSKLSGVNLSPLYPQHVQTSAVKNGQPTQCFLRPNRSLDLPRLLIDYQKLPRQHHFVQKVSQLQGNFKWDLSAVSHGWRSLLNIFFLCGSINFVKGAIFYRLSQKRYSFVGTGRSRWRGWAINSWAFWRWNGFWWVGHYFEYFKIGGKSTVAKILGGGHDFGPKNALECS